MSTLPYIDKLDSYSSHSVIGNILKSLPAGKKILDVGTATGTVARVCRDSHFVLSGIEPNIRYAEIAKPLYHCFSVTTLSETSDKFLLNQDVVICADILEHLADPYPELERLVRLQHKDSIFIISVPNVANIWVRVNLFMGRFDYADRGILDQTHLRFFTRKTIMELVKQSGLQIQKVIPTPIPLNLFHPFFDATSIGRWLHKLLQKITQVFPTIMGYQFVIVAQKNYTVIQGGVEDENCYCTPSI